MTQEQKVRILELRNQGKGYGEIAKELGMNRSTVHKFCNSVNNNSKFICKCCGKVIKEASKTKPKKFCCDNCRDKWWNKNRDKTKNKDRYKKTCLECKCDFFDYKRRNQKFCSVYCYNKHRAKAGEVNE